jgi:dTDP-glucose 4,6-dehydratase
MYTLITGGNGFIGMYLKEIFDKFEVEYFSPSSSQLDITDYTSVESYIENNNISKIVHLAAVIDNYSLKSFEVNIIGTYNLISASKKFNIDKFIFISTNNVYEENGEYDENSIIQPNNLYGKLKHVAEQLVVNYSNESLCTCTILRLGDVYGINQKYGNLFKTFFVNSLKNENFNIYGEGQRVRDYIYVKDVTRCIWYFLNNDLNGTYNVGSGIGISTKQLAKIMNKIISKDGNKIIYSPIKNDDKSQRILNNSKLKETGFELKYTLQTGIEDMIKENGKSNE